MLTAPVVSACRSFDTKAGEWHDVQLPFEEFIPLFRAKTVKGGPQLDASTVTSIQVSTNTTQQQQETGSHVGSTESIQNCPDGRTESLALIACIALLLGEGNNRLACAEFLLLTSILLCCCVKLFNFRSCEASAYNSSPPSPLHFPSNQSFSFGSMQSPVLARAKHVHLLLYTIAFCL